MATEGSDGNNNMDTNHQTEILSSSSTMVDRSKMEGAPQPSTDSTAATAKLVWSTSDRLRLKLKANDGIALNAEYETAPPLPDSLTIFDEDGDAIRNASFVDIWQNYSIQYKEIRYYFIDVVAERPSPPQQDGEWRCCARTLEVQNKSKKQKLEDTKPPFRKENYDFKAVVNLSINNVTESVVYEREQVEKEIVRWIKPKKASSKPNCATIWSGRGSGKTSLIRKMVTKSKDFQAARDCGRLMIFDAKLANVGTIPSDLAVADVSQIHRFIAVLVAFHLCKIFGDTSVDGVDFASKATVGALWEPKENLPSSLVNKLKEIQTGNDAYDWWKSCTQGFLGDGEAGPNPVIFIDTAETLALVHNRLSPANKEEKLYAATEESESAGTESIVIQSSSAATASAETKVSTPPTERYLVLEWIMMCIPNDHAMVVFGTGQRRKLSVPLDFQTHVNHSRVAPLNALSEKAAFLLFSLHAGNQVVNDPQHDLKPLQKRFVRLAYAVTAGIPRMLVTAFESEGHALASTRNEMWEKAARSLYNDVSILIGDGRLSVSCLAKAVLISAVCDVQLKDGISNKIPGEDVTWDDLRWSSIAFLAGGANGEQGCFRIPRLLWQSAAEGIGRWVKKTCRFDVHDLLPTIHRLYEDAGDASATSSGSAWEKMFASALVARFFALCWIEEREPDKTYVGLDRLLPQKNEDDMKTVSKVEVCLANGIVANAQKEAFATKTLEGGFDPKAIHANWEHQSAHHDMILPVRYKQGKRQTNYAVSARNGHHKTEQELLDTKQHLVEKGGQTEVAGIIQALNPRCKQSGRKLVKKFQELTGKEKYAEVIITKGHVHYVLGCFS